MRVCDTGMKSKLSDSCFRPAAVLETRDAAQTIVVLIAPNVSTTPRESRLIRKNARVVDGAKSCGKAAGILRREGGRVLVVDQISPEGGQFGKCGKKWPNFANCISDFKVRKKQS
eukprot:561291-Rhodomonas_salina.2